METALFWSPKTHSRVRHICIILCSSCWNVVLLWNFLNIFSCRVLIVVRKFYFPFACRTKQNYSCFGRVSRGPSACFCRLWRGGDPGSARPWDDCSLAQKRRQRRVIEKEEWAGACGAAGMASSPLQCSTALWHCLPPSSTMCSSFITWRHLCQSTRLIKSLSMWER